MTAMFDASAIGDPDSTRTVYAIIALLVVIGLALFMLAFWLRRSTRPDPEFLAPLEVMGERSWRNGDPVWQRRRLDEVRPDGAVPLMRASLPPRIDESFDLAPSATGFEDLRDDDRALGSDHDRVEDRDAGREADEDGTTSIPPPDVRHLATAFAVDEAAVTSTSDADDDLSDASDQAAAATAPKPADPSHTPIASERPLDDFGDPSLGDADFDPDALARAMAELDDELQRRRNDQ
jgi:hypothetical protein